MSLYVLLVVELWLLTILALLIHHYRQIYSLIPFMLFTSGLISILNFSDPFGLYFNVSSGITLTIMADVFIPIVLMCILILYAIDGTRLAQMAILGVVMMNMLAIMTYLSLQVFTAIAGSQGEVSGLLMDAEGIEINFRVIFASVVAFIVDTFVVAILYQGISNAFPKFPKAFVPVFALVGTLWFDAVIFNTLGFVGTESLGELLPGDIISKTASALLIAPFMVYYLTKVVPQQSSSYSTAPKAKPRPTLDILHASSDYIVRALRTTENELRESRRTYQQLTENIEEIFWMADIETRHIEYLSPAFEKIIGVPREGLYRDASTLIQNIHQADRDRILQFLVRFPNMVKEEQTNEMEFRVIRPDQSTIWVRNRVFPIYDDDGELWRIAGVAEDITQSKLVQETEIALQAERHKLEALREFISDASHDLQSPLSAILLRRDLIRRAKTDEQREEFLDELEGLTLHLSSLIEDLFTLSRLDMTSEFTFKKISINKVVETVCQQVRPMAEEKNLRLEMILDENVEEMLMDEQEISRSLSNLVGNSLRYTEEGGILVQTMSMDGEIIVRVRDTGIGIEAEDLTQIFDRFFRANSATTRRIKGTGLGLAIVKKIVEKHGGQIAVESQLGEGTTFTLRFPQTLQIP